MPKKTSPQLDREVAKALRSSSIDTTVTLDRKFKPQPRDALTLAEKARQARGAASRWLKRSAAYAREGEFREANDAQTEATALGLLAARLEEEVSHLRATARRR